MRNSLIILNAILFILVGCAEKTTADNLYPKIEDAVNNELKLLDIPSNNLIARTMLTDHEYIFFYYDNDTVYHIKVLRDNQDNYMVSESGGGYKLMDFNGYALLSYNESNMSLIIGKIYDSNIKNIIFKTESDEELIKCLDDGYFYHNVTGKFGVIELIIK